MVGVVADVRQTSLDETSASQMYLAYAQGSSTGIDLIVRTRIEPAALIPTLRRTFAEIDSRVMAT